MNILYYDADKTKYDELCGMSEFVNNKFGETIFLPNSTHLLVNANACELIHVMEQLADALEKIKEERPEEYQRAKEISTVETYKRIVERNRNGKEKDI
jgi:alanine dehydrogenase